LIYLLSEGRDALLKKRTSRLINISTVVFLIITLGICIYGIASGIFFDREKLTDVINAAGIWAPVVFLILHIAQILVPIIPGGVTLAVGVIAFGPWEGFIYNYAGIVIGSFMSFFLARHYGRTFVKELASRKDWTKYEKWIESEKFDIIFAAAILFPAFPDDLLCMIAGLTKMKIKRFAFIICVLKIFSVFVYSLAVIFANSWFSGLLQ